MPESVEEPMHGILTSVQVGRIAPLGPDGVPSGFVKHTVDGPITVGPVGLEGDEQADLAAHGGSDKAVYGYGLSAYRRWLLEFPEHEQLLRPGGLGENLTISGLDETRVCIGDIVRIGAATLQVTQPRQPCFKFALRFDDPRLPQAMVANGLCGWYYRVLDGGAIAAGDVVTLDARPNPLWPIARFYRLIATRSATHADMAEFAVLEGLAEQWRKTARAAIGAPVA